MLGDHKEKIYPSEKAVQKLEDILKRIVPGEHADIIWDSAIDVMEFDNDVEVKNLIVGEKE